MSPLEWKVSVGMGKCLPEKRAWKAEIRLRFAPTVGALALLLHTDSFSGTVWSFSP